MMFNHNMHVDATLKGNIARFGVGRLSDQSCGGLVATPSMMYSSSSTGRSVIFPMVLNKVGELRHFQLPQKGGLLEDGVGFLDDRGVES